MVFFVLFLIFILFVGMGGIEFKIWFRYLSVFLSFGIYGFLGLIFSGI